LQPAARIERKLSRLCHDCEEVRYSVDTVLYLVGFLGLLLNTNLLLFGANRILVVTHHRLKLGKVKSYDIVKNAVWCLRKTQHVSLRLSLCDLKEDANSLQEVLLRYPQEVISSVLLVFLSLKDYHLLVECLILLLALNALICHVHYLFELFLGYSVVTSVESFLL
jgi:hypothetical protein